MYPFSDDFTDYDMNGDKEIEYEEFVFAVMKTFPMAEPEELREPFIWADANGNFLFHTTIATQKGSVCYMGTAKARIRLRIRAV